MSFHEALAPLVERAANATAHKWPSYVTTEDVAQEIWIWAYGRQNSVESLMKNEGWEGQVYSTMLKAASAAAKKEDQATNSYTDDDTYVYSSAVVETLLDSAFDYQDWQSFSTFGDGMPRAKGQVNETGDFVAMLSDVKAALAEIKVQYRDVLYLRHCAQLGFEEIATALGIQKSGAKKRHAAAINAVRDALGRVDLSDLQSGWDSRRQSLGNAEANAITDRQYEG
jgi:DNA-directed RNA polymerase specialized sigma24 family protein